MVGTAVPGIVSQPMPRAWCDTARGLQMPPTGSARNVGRSQGVDEVPAAACGNVVQHLDHEPLAGPMLADARVAALWTAGGGPP